jgi:hypothetical protein
MEDFSVALPNKLARDLRKAAGDEVSAFVADAIKKDLAHRHLRSLERKLAEQLGPAEEVRVAEFRVMLAQIDVVNAAAREGESAARKSRSREEETAMKDLTHRHLREVIRDLEDRLGPADETQVARFMAMIAEVRAAKDE